MDTRPFLEASSELRGHFFDLIESLSALRGLTDLDVHHQSEQSLMRRAIDLLVEHDEFERCSIFLLRDATLRCVAGSTWGERYEALAVGEAERRAPRPLEFALGEGLIGLAAQRREVQHCPDCAAATRDGLFSVPDAAPARGALMSAPILNGGEVLGVLNVYHAQAGGLTVWHERLLVLYCGVIGHMLSNHRLLVRLDETVRRRTRQLETALRMAEQLKLRYEQLSNIDELTSLHNRRFFFPEAEAALSRATRYGHPFSLTILDIDHFKRINDTHGHALGDTVLRDVAEALRQSVREGDILSRFGGEEFVVALPNTERAGALLLAERIMQAVATLRWATPQGEVTITVSCGVSSLEGRTHADNKSLLDLLVREADTALYRAKSLGRARVESSTGPLGQPPRA